MNKNLTIFQRFQAPVPPLFAKIRNIGLAVVGVSMAVLAVQTQGIVLPTVLVWIASKTAAVAGVVSAVISQLTVDWDKLKSNQALDNIKK